MVLAAQRRDHRAGRRRVVGALLTGAVLLAVYWAAWLLDRSLLASDTRPAYYEFEAAFALADAWLAFCLVAGARALAGRRPTALLWLLAAGGAAASCWPWTSSTTSSTASGSPASGAWPSWCATWPPPPARSGCSPGRGRGGPSCWPATERHGRGPLATPDRPVAGRDYPADRDQFLAFPDEAACLRYLERLSWPASSARPAVEAGPPWRGSRQRLVCRSCGRRPPSPPAPCSRGRGRRCASGSPPPGWWPRPSRACPPASWPRPWTWAATRRPGRCCTGSGGPWSARAGPSWSAGSRSAPWRHRDGPTRRPGGSRQRPPSPLEDRGETPGRVRMQRLPSAAGGRPGRVPRPRGGAGDAGPGRAPGGLVAAGRARLHDRAGAGPDPPAGGRAGPGRWLRGTHHGATSPAQLDWYLDEFTFRFNRRSSTHRGLLFYRLLEEAVVTPPQPYHGVVGT